MEQLLEPSTTCLLRMYEAESRNSAILSGQNSIIKPSMLLTPMSDIDSPFIEIIDCGESLGGIVVRVDIHSTEELHWACSCFAIAEYD